MKRAQIEALARKVRDWKDLTRLASTPPWQAAPGERIGKGWLIASLGASAEDGHDWLVTTKGVHASEMDGDAKADAAFIAGSREAMPILIKIAEAFLAERLGEAGGDVTA